MPESAPSNASAPASAGNAPAPAGAVGTVGPSSPDGPGGPLTGELVQLRELREEDLPQLTAWWNDQDLAPLQVTGPAQPRPAAQIAEMFREWSQNTGAAVGLSVVTREGGRLAGHVALFGAEVKDRCATLAIVIGPPFQGRGIGGDAVRTILRHGFDELGLHRVELTAHGYNERAVATYARAGFREEGRRREAVFRRGRWHDQVQMGILASEWRDGRAQDSAHDLSAAGGSAQAPSTAAADATPGQTGVRPGAGAASASASASAGADDTALRIEVFVEDMDAFVDFYTRVLGFALAEDRRTTDNPYAAVVRGTVQIGAVKRWGPLDRAARSVPTGAEIVLEVGDLDAAHRRVRASGWPLAQDLREQPWRLTDFRLYDPDGYYLRVTNR